MSALVDPLATLALADLSRGLVEYQRVSGKLSAAILVQKGAQLVYGNQDPKFGAVFPGLFQLFAQQQPARGVILATAKARHFRTGRISAEAYARARFWMGGFKSILARPTDDGERITLGAVRAGARRGKNNFRILGGRKGRGGSAVSGSGVFAAGAGLARQPGEKILNLRAVATAMELNLRTSGRGFMGASWLHRRWRRLAASDPRRDASTFRVLVNANPRSKISPLGTAGLEGDEAHGDLTLRITSYVPGVQGLGTTRGLFLRAIAGVRADLDTYLARKHAEALASALRREVSALERAAA